MNVRLELWVEGEHDASVSHDGRVTGVLPMLVRRVLEPSIKIADEQISVEKLASHVKKQVAFRRDGAERLGVWTRKLLTAFAQADVDRELIVVAAWDRDRKDENETFARDAAAVLTTQGRARMHVLLSVEAVESLLLVDPDAFEAAFDCRPPRLPPAPEAVENPKEELRRALEACGEERNRATYAAVAQHVSLKRLESACSKGFGTFMRRFTQAAERLAWEQGA